MQLGGETHFDAPLAAVWRALIHPDTLAATLPGVASVSVHDDTHWSAHVRLHLGKIPLRMRVAVALVEQREPERARLHAHGRGVGGSLTVETAFDLHEVANGTHMQWTADVELTGPARRLGGQLLRPLVDRQVAKVLETVRRQSAAASA